MNTDDNFKNEDILNEFEAGSTFKNLEKEEEYYRMFISRYGYDPRNLDDAA